MNGNAYSLAGSSALVTGGNSGIGKACSLALAKAGAAVAINYVTDADIAQQMAGEIAAAGGKALAVAGDVGREAEVKAMFNRVQAEFGGLDILINNAGIQRDSPLVDMTLQQWTAVIETNLTGQFLCAREAARLFIGRGLDPKRSPAAGKIICMSSVHQQIPWSGHVNYAASKGGVAMLVKTLAQELAPQRIRVNAVAPGAIQTPINRAAWSDPERREKMLRLVPYGRIGTPGDVAEAVLWLASDLSDYVTGATLVVDVGMLLYPGFADGSG